MAKLILSMDEMQDDFFSDTAMIGMASAQPGYRLCWLLNNYFDIDLKGYPEQNIQLKKKGNTFHFPVYQYDLENCCYKHLLYKLKCGAETLLPETKHLDYLWLIQTADPEHDAQNILKKLKDMPDVQMARALVTEQIQNSLTNLLV